MTNMQSRRRFLKLTAGAAVAAPFINLGSYRVFAGSERSYSKRAVDLVNGSLVIDTLSPIFLSDQRGLEWFGNPAATPDWWFEDLKKSGINVLHHAMGTVGLDANREILLRMAAFNGFLAHHSDYLLRVDSAADLDKAHSGDRTGFIYGVQNADHFQKVDDVNQFWGLGQRVAQLTYNARNLIGTGSTDRIDGGLSDYGVAIVERMNEVGMAVDVSHCGDRTTLDAFEVSKKPVLVTHSNVRALVEGHVRCKPDEVIKKVAEKGSVMGITGVRMFIRATEPTTLEHLLDHFDYVVKMAGMDHVGVGSDIDLYGYDAMSKQEQKDLRAYYTKGKYKFREKIDIEAVAHPQRMFDLTEGLISRGYSDANIRSVLGGNFRRVLQEIWG